MDLKTLLGKPQVRNFNKAMSSSVFLEKMVATTVVCFFQLFSVWGLVCIVYHNFLSQCVITKVHQNPDPVLSMAPFSLAEIVGAWKDVNLLSL